MLLAVYPWVLLLLVSWYRKETRDRLSVFCIAICFMAVLSAETGLSEKFIFLALRRSRETLLINFTGLLIVLFAGSVGLSVLPRSN